MIFREESPGAAQLPEIVEAHRAVAGRPCVNKGRPLDCGQYAKADDQREGVLMGETAAAALHSCPRSSGDWIIHRIDWTRGS